MNISNPLHSSIPLISRILSFAVKGCRDACRARCVSAAFQDTVDQYADHMWELGPPRSYDNVKVCYRACVHGVTWFVNRFLHGVRRACEAREKQLPGAAKTPCCTVNDVLQWKDSNYGSETLGFRLLQIAIFHGHLQICAILLDFGADVNVLDTMGRSAVHIAAMKNHVDILTLLISRGADIQPRFCATTNGEVAPLFVAIAQNSVEAVKVLIDNGVDVVHVDRVGRSALHRAASLGHVLIVRLLVEAAPWMMKQKSNDGLTPLDEATRRRQTQVVAFLETFQQREQV